MCAKASWQNGFEWVRENYKFGPSAGAGDAVGGDPPGLGVVPEGGIVPGGGVVPGGAQLVGRLGFSGFNWQLALAPVDSNRIAW